MTFWAYMDEVFHLQMEEYRHREALRREELFIYGAINRQAAQHFNMKGITIMAALDKVSGATVKELEINAEHYTTFEDFEADVRMWAGNVWNGEPTRTLSDGTAEELKTLGTQYDSVVDFQNEAARYAELAWGHARQAADPGPQANAHLTGTAAGGDVPPGNAGSPLWAPGGGGETVEESGVVTSGPIDDGSITKVNVNDPEPAEAVKSYE